MDEEILMQISRDIGKLQGTVSAMDDRLERVSKQVTSLPCETHAQELRELLECADSKKKTQETANLETMKGNISLRNAIVLIAITNLFTVIIALITNYFIIGKP